MPPQIVTYAGLRAGVSAWLARSGDTLLESRFDDFLLNCERRMYYGHATEDAANPLRSEPLRIVEMETADPAFVLQESVAQPPGFLELISAVLNDPLGPMEIVSQRTLDGYGPQSLGGPRKIAVSGTRFRVKDDPAGAAATLRYYRRLATPEGSTVNDILAAYPDVYLFGCLVEAAIFTQGEAEAQRYLSLYNASVAGLNARTQRITASAAPVLRLRAGMTP
ncbi:MAG: phage adaptor protein [Pseudomonadota bacterium]